YHAVRGLIQSNALLAQTGFRKFSIEIRIRGCGILMVAIKESRRPARTSRLWRPGLAIFRIRIVTGREEPLNDCCHVS
ncbi:MAG: hypothetical protein AB7G88_10885, partial [Thermomicrobiales bacterium]